MLSPSKENVFMIGIIGSNGKSSTANMLSCIFTGAGLNVEVIDSKKNVTHKRNMPNIESNKLLKKFDNNDIIIVVIDEELLRSKSLHEFNFDMIVHCHISEDSYENTEEGICSINSLINSNNGIKTIILNTDDKNWKNVIIDLENTYLITYGLGSKATVTASSIECGKDIHFQFCLQRFLTCFDDKTIEPMEIPVIIKVFGQYNVYNGLASITAALLYGIPADTIVSAMNTCIDETGLKIVYENGFGVVDNVCDTLLSFESGFEAIQDLPYDNIHLVFDFPDKKPLQINEKIMNVIGAWSLILKIKEIYIFGKNKNNSLLLNSLATLNNNVCSITCLEGGLTDIEGIINSLKDKDMLLFFCSSSYNTLRDKMIEILDKRILGNLS